MLSAIWNVDSAIWKLKMTRRSSLLPGRGSEAGGERSQIKSPKPLPGVKQPTSCIHSDEKTLVKYLPDIMRFWAFPSISVRNGL